MNLTKFFLILILFLTFNIEANSQDSSKAILVDEFTNLFCSDDLKARLDHLLVAIHNKPESLGFIVARADASMPGRFHKYFRMFQQYLRFRGFDPARVRFYRGQNTSSLHFQLWLSPDGAPPLDVPLEFKSEPIESSVMYDASEISFVSKNAVEFGGNWADEPCDFGLELNHFATMLSANPTLNVYLVASSTGRRDAAKAKAALNLTAKELIKKHGVPPRRIKTLYVGNRKSRVMQLWFVPKGAQPPSFRENSIP